MFRHPVPTVFAALLAAAAPVFAAPLPATPTPAAETAPPTNIVRLRPTMVPVIVNGQVARYAFYEITLEIAVPARIPEIQLKQPRLQDTATSVMYEAVDKGWIAGGSITNATALRTRLAEASNALLGPGTVSRVLITPAAQRQS